MSKDDETRLGIEPGERIVGAWLLERAAWFVLVLVFGSASCLALADLIWDVPWGWTLVLHWAIGIALTSFTVIGTMLLSPPHWAYLTPFLATAALYLSVVTAGVPCWTSTDSSVAPIRFGLSVGIVSLPLLAIAGLGWYRLVRVLRGHCDPRRAILKKIEKHRTLVPAVILGAYFASFCVNLLILAAPRATKAPVPVIPIPNVMPASWQQGKNISRALSNERSSQWQTTQVDLKETGFSASVGPVHYTDEDNEDWDYYAIEVEKRIDARTSRTYFRRELPLAAVPTDISHAEQVVHYDDDTRTVTFSIGELVYTYTLPEDEPPQQR